MYKRQTIADGLGGNIQAGSITFDLVRDLGVTMSLVSEAAIARALVDTVQHDHLIVEGAAATAIAGVASGAVPGAGRTVVVVVTGANIDRLRLGTLLA